MITLQTSLGSRYSIDSETGSILLDDGYICDEQISVAITEIHPVLLNKSLRYPEEVYRHCRRVRPEHISLENQAVSCDMVHIPQGLLGVEYNRTHIYDSPQTEGKFSCMVEVLEGELTVVLQKNAEDQDMFSILSEVEEVRILTLREGDKCAIPSGYMYTFANASSGDVLFTIITIQLNKVDYSQLIREKGLAVFIIAKNSIAEVVTNPKYRMEGVPEVEVWRETEQEERETFENDFTNRDESFFDLSHLFAEELAEFLV